MLKRISRFVLEVLPYLLSALAAAFLGFGFLFSQVHATKATDMPNVPAGVVNARELIRWDHAAFAPDHMLFDGVANMAGDKLAYR